MPALTLQLATYTTLQYFITRLKHRECLVKPAFVQRTFYLYTRKKFLFCCQGMQTNPNEHNILVCRCHNVVYSMQSRHYYEVQIDCSFYVYNMYTAHIPKAINLYSVGSMVVYTILSVCIESSVSVFMFFREYFRSKSLAFNRLRQSPLISLKGSGLRQSEGEAKLAVCHSSMVFQSSTSCRDSG